MAQDSIETNEMATPYWEAPKEAQEGRIQEKDYDLDDGNWRMRDRDRDEDRDRRDREDRDRERDEDRDRRDREDRARDRDEDRDRRDRENRDRNEERNRQWWAMGDGTGQENMEESPMDMTFALAMAYVPRQKWGELYTEEVGFQRGTIFPELDKPFIGEGVSNE